jgi:class 3 adenylate cyclase
VHEHLAWEHEDGITAVVALGTVQQIAGAVEEIQAHCGDHAQVAMFPVRRAGAHWGMVVRGAGAFDSHTTATILLPVDQAGACP